MKENKHWFIMLILEYILIMLLFEFSRALVKNGNTYLGYGLEISVYIYLFYNVIKITKELLN